VQASLQINNIPTGAGDDIKLDGAWSLGASIYVLGTSAAAPSLFDIFNGTRFAMGVTTATRVTARLAVASPPTAPLWAAMATCRLNNG
jgi:hypothetical protein